MNKKVSYNSIMYTIPTIVYQIEDNTELLEDEAMTIMMLAKQIEEANKAAKEAADSSE